MNTAIYTQILATLVEAGALAGLVVSLFYLHNQNRQERVLSDQRWANLKTESDARFIVSDERWAKMIESFTDFKNVTVSRFADLDRKIEELKNGSEK